MTNAVTPDIAAGCAVAALRNPAFLGAHPHQSNHGHRCVYHQISLCHQAAALVVRPRPNQAQLGNRSAHIVNGHLLPTPGIAESSALSAKRLIRRARRRTTTNSTSADDANNAPRHPPPATMVDISTGFIMRQGQQLKPVYYPVATCRNSFLANKASSRVAQTKGY
jgi:hypothetical protein